MIEYLLSDEVVALVVLEELVHLDDIGVILNTTYDYLVNFG